MVKQVDIFTKTCYNKLTIIFWRDYCEQYGKETLYFTGFGYCSL